MYSMRKSKLKNKRLKLVYHKKDYGHAYYFRFGSNLPLIYQSKLYLNLP